MPWTLSKLSYVQVDSFPQNEIARNRISGEKSEFDSNSATNTFGIGLQVVPLHDWKSDEVDGASIPDGGLGTVVDFVKNSADTSKKMASVQWDDGTRCVHNATCNDVNDPCIFHMSSLGKWVALLHHIICGITLLFKF